MKIEGQLNLSLMVEALTEMANTLESRIMNGRYENKAEHMLMCAKLRRIRFLNNHIQQAAMSEVIDKTVSLG